MPCWYFQINECTKTSRNSRGKTRAMEFHFYTRDFFFPFTTSFLYKYIQKDSLHLFFSCCVRISRTMNAKISKFEREDKSNGIPLLHHGLFFFFDEIFPIYIQKDSLQFFFMPCSYFQKNECKKISKFEGKTRGMESHFYNMVFFFFFHENFHTYYRSTYMQKCVFRKMVTRTVRIISEPPNNNRTFER